MKNELLDLCGKFGVKAGRKSRQTARKIAKNNPNRTVRVISKKGYVLYIVIFDGQNFNSWIFRQN